MPSIKLLIRGSMVSLSTLALFAALASADARADSRTQHVFAPGPPAPRSGGWPPTGAHLPGNPTPGPAVPRGDLRSDIADNARQRTPPRPEPPAQPRR
jgi:hypothetical protein